MQIVGSASIQQCCTLVKVDRKKSIIRLSLLLLSIDLGCSSALYISSHMIKSILIMKFSQHRLSTSYTTPVLDRRFRLQTKDRPFSIESSFSLHWNQVSISIKVHIDPCFWLLIENEESCKPAGNSLLTIVSFYILTFNSYVDIQLYSHYQSFNISFAITTARSYGPWQW